MSLILLYVFVGVVVIQFFYYLGIFSFYAFSKKKDNNFKKIPVSVILYAKNSEQEVCKILPILLNQNYYSYEVVMVNNASFDRTLEVYREYSELYPNTNVVDVKNNEAFWGSKKYALTLGIKAAKYDYLLFVDAEQDIKSSNWLLSMSSHFTLNKNIVLGYSLYEKSKGFFNKIVRYGQLFTNIHQFSWSRIGKVLPIEMENIGYKKETFFNNSGFVRNMQIPENTNELFLKEVATTHNVAFSQQEDSIKYLPSITKLSQLFEKKAAHRKMLHRLGVWAMLKVKIYNISVFLFYVLLVWLSILQENLVLFISILIIRYLISWIVIGKLARKFNDTDISWLYPILEINQLFLWIILLFKRK